MRRRWLSGSQSRVAIAVVTCTFLAASITAYQVYEAVCAQEEATDQALRAHARFAGWSFAREASEELERGARRVLETVRARASVAPTLPPSRLVASALADARDCACVVLPQAKYVFRLDLHDRTLDASGSEGGGEPSFTDRAWMADTVARLAGSRRAAAGDPVFVSRPRHDGLTLAFSTLTSEEGVPYAVYGFAFDARDAGHAIFPLVLGRRPLLPPSTLGAQPLDSALTLSVVAALDDDRTPLFTSRAHRSTGPTVETPMNGPFAGLVVRTAMRPAFRDRVAVGSWTWNRSQFVLGLITVTAGLIVVSILQLHRERQMARLRGEFVSNVSHELRTPLAQIRMFAEMLRLGWVRSDDERRRSVQVIDQEARRLAHLVENILFYSRAERAATRVTVEPIDLAPLVDEVVDGFRPLSAARAMQVRTTHAGVATALADRDAMRQMLLNLLDNAVKYGPPGQTITVRTERPGDGRAMVCVVVDDQGPGIAPRDRSRVWEPFRRLERAVDAGIAGNGIGLAVVHELARAQGGDVRVDAAPGGGARFIIALRAVHLERWESAPSTSSGGETLGEGEPVTRDAGSADEPLWGDPRG